MLRLHHRYLSTLFILSLTACAPGASATPTPTAPPTTIPPTARPTIAPTSTVIPSIITATPSPTPIDEVTISKATPTATIIPELFQVSTKLSGLNAMGEWDSFYRDPGAMVYHEGQFHMFYNGINGFPRPVGIGYATSADGEHWRIRTPQPVFNLGPLTYTGLYNGPNLFVTSALVEDDGTWMLYYYTIAGNSFDGRLTIARATAPDPLGPWTPDPEPVLLPGSAGEWDARQVSGPNVIKTDTGYVMYYDGMGRSSMIGMATSPDGKTWTKYDDPTTTAAPYAESDPVLVPTEGTWDSRRVMDPNVIKTDSGWVMVYLSADGTQKFNGQTYSFGLATSTDGIGWKKVGDQPILSSANHPKWNGIYLATLIRHETTWFLYFDVARGNTGQTSINLTTYEGELGQ